METLDDLTHRLRQHATSLTSGLSGPLHSYFRVRPAFLHDFCPGRCLTPAPGLSLPRNILDLDAGFFEQRVYCLVKFLAVNLLVANDAVFDGVFPPTTNPLASELYESS